MFLYLVNIFREKNVPTIACENAIDVNVSQKQCNCFHQFVKVPMQVILSYLLQTAFDSLA